MTEPRPSTGDERRLAALVAGVAPVDHRAGDEARRRLAALATPPGSLGTLARLGVSLTAIAGRCPPPPPRHPALIVAAADHGVHAQGVTPWPQAVTAAMVGQLCGGGAVASVVAGVVGARVRVLDVGVVHDVAPHPDLVQDRISAGTADLSTGPAMTRGQAVRAALAGARTAQALVAGGTDLLVTGDMGIANSTASACIVASFTGSTADGVTGRGAGADDVTLARKLEVVTAALRRHRLGTVDPLGALAAVGGLEHAALAGAMLAAAGERMPVLLDGLASLAAALVAVELCPSLRGYLLAGHVPADPGGRIALTDLDLHPPLYLDMRLGEGAAALLAVPVVAAAAGVLAGTSLLEEVTGRGSPLPPRGEGGAESPSIRRP